MQSKHFCKTTETPANIISHHNTFPRNILWDNSVEYFHGVHLSIVKGRNLRRYSSYSSVKQITYVLGTTTYSLSTPNIPYPWLATSLSGVKVGLQAGHKFQPTQKHKVT